MSTRRIKTLTLLLLMTACFVSPGFPDCKVYQDKWQEQQTIVLENNLIKVVLIPASNGRIAEYVFKPANTDQFRKLVLKELEISPEFKMVSSNMAGYEDWIWELGATAFVNRSARYKSKITENTPKRCSVVLSYESACGIDRTITISDDSALLDVTTKLTNLMQGGQTYSYWIHTMVHPGGASDLRDLDVYIPVAKGGGSRRGCGMVKCDVDTVHKQNLEISAANIFAVPSQGWWGFVSRKSSQALIQLVNVKELGEDGFLYSNKGAAAGDSQEGYSLSMEAVYKSQSMIAGESATYHASYGICKGLDSLAYADSNIVVSLAKPVDVSGGDIKVNLKIGSFTVLDGVSGKAYLVRVDGQTLGSADISVPAISPTTPADVSLAFKQGTNSVGQCHIRLELSDSKGNKISQCELLEPLAITERSK